VIIFLEHSSHQVYSRAESQESRLRTSSQNLNICFLAGLSPGFQLQRTCLPRSVKSALSDFHGKLAGAPYELMP
jgi:hypothetical protein